MSTDNIMYYLVVILFSVGWILLSIVRNYISSKSPISHKYLNHGIEKVPAYVNSSSIRLLLNYVFFFNLFCILLIKAYIIQMLKPIKREQEVVRMFLQCLFYNVF